MAKCCLLLILALVLSACSNQNEQAYTDELIKLEARRVELQQELMVVVSEALKHQKSGDVIAFKKGQENLSKTAFSIWHNQVQILGTLSVVEEACGSSRDEQLAKLAKLDQLKSEALDAELLNEAELLEIEEVYWSQQDKISLILKDFGFGWKCVALGISNLFESS